MRTSTLLSLIALATPLLAHPHELHQALPDAELSRRQLIANKRHADFGGRCAQAAVRHRAARKAKRAALVKRQTSASASASSTSSAATPHYSVIQNTTCLTTPEVTEGPYHIQQELIRSDITDGQTGVKLLLDIGVLDTTTCLPLENAMVDLWHCNATGSYSGYTTAGGGGGGGGGASGGPGASMSAGGQQAGMPSGAAPSGGMGVMPSSGSGGGSPGGMTTALTDELNFLRGMYATNSEGLVEFDSVVPGWYSGRTVHMHTAVIQDYERLDNGTIAYGSGSVRHIGQIFFEDDLITQLAAFSPYSTITTERTYNADDSIMNQESADGYNAVAETELLGSSIEDGIVAYITIGVDTTATTAFSNANAYSPNGISSLSASYRASASASAAQLDASTVPNSGSTRSTLVSTGFTLLGAAFVRMLA